MSIKIIIQFQGQDPRNWNYYRIDNLGQYKINPTPKLIDIALGYYQPNEEIEINIPKGVIQCQKQQK